MNLCYCIPRLDCSTRPHYTRVTHAALHTRYTRRVTHALHTPLHVCNMLHKVLCVTLRVTRCVVLLWSRLLGLYRSTLLLAGVVRHSAPSPPPLFSIVCGFRLSPASAFLFLAPAVSSAGAQLPPAFPASLSISRPLYFFVSPPSLLPEAGAVRKGQRASSLMCCALCTVPVGCVVSSAGAFVRGVLHALSWSSSPFVVVCLCQRVLWFVMLIAVARDLACSAFLWRLFCRCKFVMRFVSHDSLIKSGDSWLRASTRQSCDMPACIEARYSVPRGELVHSGCDV